MDEHMVWMWRELLLATLSRGFSTKRIDEDLLSLRHLKLQERLCGMIRLKGCRSINTSKILSCLLLPAGNEDDAPDEHEFWDYHWTAAMKDAASKFRQSSHNDVVRSFRSSPSTSECDKLILAHPHLRSDLLNAMRYCVFKNPQACYRADVLHKTAVALFKKEKKTDDLVRLLDSIGPNSYTTKPYFATIEPDIVSFLSTRPKINPQKLLDRIASGLVGAKQKAIQMVESSFPGWSEATCWLQDEINNGSFKVSRQASVE